MFYVLPALYGDLHSAVPLRWDPTFPACIGILPRDGGSDDVRWFDVEACTISHVANAFEAGDTVGLDAVRAPFPLQPHVLQRFIFDLRSGRVSESVLVPRFLDFPRVHPAVVGSEHRYLYSLELLGFRPDGGFAHTVAYQHDLQTGRALAHDFGEDGIGAAANAALRRRRSHW